MADPNPIDHARLLGVIRGYATALDDLEAWLVDRIARAENAMARIRSVNGNPNGSPRHTANVVRLGNVNTRRHQLRYALDVVREWRDQ